MPTVPKILNVGSDKKVFKVFRYLDGVQKKAGEN
jgi:hypothetical protein